MDFCSIFTIARVIMGSVKKGEKYEGYYLLEVFLIGGNLTKLCLYMCLSDSNHFTCNGTVVNRTPSMPLLELVLAIKNVC